MGILSDLIYCIIGYSKSLWNCKHLSNALTRGRLVGLIETFGYESPVICTPEELMQDVL
jgi:hypothetical protein